MWEQAEFLATNTDKDKKNRGARPRASLDCIHGTIPTRPDAPPALGAAHARCRADAAPESREGTRAAAASPLFRASHEVSAAAPAARHGRWAAGTPRQPLAQPPPAPVRRNAGRAAAPTPLPPRGGRLSHAPPMGAGKGEPLRGRAGPDGGGTSRIAARGASPSPASRSTSPAARRVAGPWSTPRRFCQTKKKGHVSERRPSPGCGPPARPGAHLPPGERGAHQRHRVRPPGQPQPRVRPPAEEPREAAAQSHDAGDAEPADDAHRRRAAPFSRLQLRARRRAPPRPHTPGPPGQWWRARTEVCPAHRAARGPSRDAGGQRLRLTRPPGWGFSTPAAGDSRTCPGRGGRRGGDGGRRVGLPPQAPCFGPRRCAETR